MITKDFESIKKYDKRQNYIQIRFISSFSCEFYINRYFDNILSFEVKLLISVLGLYFVGKNNISIKIKLWDFPRYGAYHSKIIVLLHITMYL